MQAPDHAPADAVYSPDDVAFVAGGAGGGADAAHVRRGIEGAHALFAVEIGRLALRPHAAAICDAKEPADGDVRLLLLLMHLVDKVGLNVATPGPSDDHSPYFEHMGELVRRIDVFCEHVVDEAGGFVVGLRYTFAVMDPTLDIAAGIEATIALNRQRVAEEEKRGKRTHGGGGGGGDDDAGDPWTTSPWKAHLSYLSVHDVAQSVDGQLAAALGPAYRYCIDREADVVGRPLRDRLNPANPQVALGYRARYGAGRHGGAALRLRARHAVSDITGLHSLHWDAPFHLQVAHIAAKFSNPEVFFALPFHTPWKAGRVAATPGARLAATALLRKRTLWEYKEYTDLEHLTREMGERWQRLAGAAADAAPRDRDALRRECEGTLAAVLRSRASRLPAVVKAIMGHVEANPGLAAAPPPVPPEPQGLDAFGRWLIAKVEAVRSDGGIVAHLRNFMRSDLVAFAALRRDRNLLCPVMLSRGIRGSGKSEQSQQCLGRHVNGRRAGYTSAKSLYVHDRDREKEEYFPKDGWCHSYDEMPASLTSERVGLSGSEKEENAMYKEMLSSGKVSWEVMSQWGAGTKRKSQHGVVSCYCGILINSNKKIRFSDSMASRIRVQEFLGNHRKTVRKMIGTGGGACDARAAARNAAWKARGRASEKNQLIVHEYLRATGGADRTVDVSAAAHLAENFFDAYEARTGLVATARDKELYLMYCYCMCLWYETDRATEHPGGTPLRHADGRPVAFVVSESMAVAVLTLFDSTYYRHMHTKVAVAFDELARAAAESLQPHGGKRRRLGGDFVRGSQHASEGGLLAADQPQDVYAHPRNANGVYDERYAYLPNTSMAQLAHALRLRLDASVEQVSDALDEMRERKAADGTPHMRVETRAAGVPSVSMSVQYLKEADAAVDRPHAVMADVLAHVLSYPSQRPHKNIVTLWTLEPQRPGAADPSMGNDLLEVLEVRRGGRKFALSRGPAADHRGAAPRELQPDQTLDEYVRAEYERAHRLGYVEPLDRSGEGPCTYPWAALAACDRRGGTAAVMVE